MACVHYSRAAVTANDTSCTQPHAHATQADAGSLYVTFDGVRLLVDPHPRSRLNHVDAVLATCTRGCVHTIHAIANDTTLSEDESSQVFRSAVALAGGDATKGKWMRTPKLYAVEPSVGFANAAAAFAAAADDDDKDGDEAAAEEDEDDTILVQSNQVPLRYHQWQRLDGHGHVEVCAIASGRGVGCAHFLLRSRRHTLLLISQCPLEGASIAAEPDIDAVRLARVDGALILPPWEVEDHGAATMGSIAQRCTWIARLPPRLLPTAPTVARLTCSLDGDVLEVLEVVHRQQHNMALVVPVEGGARAVRLVRRICHLGATLEEFLDARLASATASRATPPLAAATMADALTTHSAASKNVCGFIISPMISAPHAPSPPTPPPPTSTSTSNDNNMSRFDDVADVLTAIWRSASFIVAPVESSELLEALRKRLLNDDRFGVVAEPGELSTYETGREYTAILGIAADEEPVASLAAEVALGASMEPLTVRIDEPPPPIHEPGGWAAPVRVRLSARPMDGRLELHGVSNASTAVDNYDGTLLREPRAAWGVANATAVVGSLRARGFVDVVEEKRERATKEEAPPNKRARTSLAPEVTTASMIVARSANGDVVRVTPGASCSHIAGDCAQAVSDAADAVMASLPREFGCKATKRI